MRAFAFLSLIPLSVGEKLVIPAVQSAVALELAQFKAYTAYTGPTGAAKAAAAAATPEVGIAALVQAASQAVTVAQPYWYESITHQGRAAFNTNTSYKVYRNVKDYGAKGCVVDPISHE